MNKKFWSFYMVIAALGFAAIASNIYYFTKTPVVSSLIKKTTNLSHSLNSSALYIHQNIDQEKYDHLLTVVQSLRGLKSMEIDAKDHRINCTYDGRELSEKKLIEAIQSEGYTVTEYFLYKSLKSVEFTITNGFTPANVEVVETIITTLPGIYSIDIDSNHEKIMCLYDSRKLTESKIIRWVSTEGYQIETL